MAPVSTRYLNVAGAAAYLSLSEDAIRHMVKRRELPFSKLGKRVRFKVDDLDHLMHQHRVEASPS